MCTSAARPQHRRRRATPNRNPTISQGAAGGAKARWGFPCCCGAPPTSCCSGRVPRRPSSCQPTRVLVQTCKQSPQQTWVCEKWYIELNDWFKVLLYSKKETPMNAIICASYKYIPSVLRRTSHWTNQQNSFQAQWSKSV